MICEQCQGRGWIWVDHLPAIGVMPGDPDRPPPGSSRSLKRPCPNCGGSGVQHCCDGPVGLTGDVGNTGE